MRVRIPCRRWVGRTVTAATAALGSLAPPGTVSSVAHDRNVPHTRSPSNAAHVRPGSHQGATCSARSGTSGRSRNAVEIASMYAAYSSTRAVRISMAIARLYPVAMRRRALDRRVS